CHEQHASIGGHEPAPDDNDAAVSALFHNTFNKAKSDAPYEVADLFCFYCHSDVSSQSIQHGAGEEMKNYDFAKTFGGATNTVAGRLVDDILETFNWPAYSGSGSNHNLLGLQNYTAANFSSWFGPNSDPCTACHNPHIARRNKLNLWDASYSAISLPSAHKEHWGDEPGEQMSDYAANYRAPLYWNSALTYEPAGTSNAVGDLMPDYNTFCLECHGVNAALIHSSHHSRNLTPINWSGSGGDSLLAGDKHGTNVRTGDVDTHAPYNNVPDLVLSCCDCHEPHGSPYDFLVRRSINGVAVGVVDGPGERGNQCRQCHMDDLALGEGNIPNRWRGTHHGGGAIADNPYHTSQMPSCGCHAVRNPIAKIPCDDCHHHGSFVFGASATPVYTDPNDGYNTIQVPPPSDGVARRTF
ncbi:MAG: hypothetical protein JXR89_02095, partial [Deltaproteobacteria bacterium]|nr:hypothetical protein [Deltaproteobacteria bacterium]